MTSPIPASGYPSNTSRTQADMQTYFETMLSITKEQLGGTGEAASVELSSNTFTPGNNACVFVIDTNSGAASDTLNTIQATNLRDGEVVFIRSTNNARVITVANAAGGAGQIYSADGNGIVLNSTKLFVALKYNAAITAFEELFRTIANPNLSSPGPIGNTTPNTGTFTTLTLTSPVGAHQWLGNSSGSSAAPAFSSLTAADLPSSVATSAGNLSPLFTSAISSQALNFTLSNAAAGSIFGNFSGSSAAPSYQAPGSNDQILGVVHSGNGLEYKTLVAGANITITPTAGTITIAATGGGGGMTNPMTTLGDIIYGGTSGTPTRLAGSTSATKNFLTITGTGSASAAPVWGTLSSSDIPPIALASGGNGGVSGILPAANGGTGAATTSAGTLFGNFSGTSTAPSFQSPGATDQLLGVAHSGGGLEYKSLVAGANITITPTAGSITIASTGSGSGMTNPMTAVGDIIYGGTSGTPSRLAGNSSSQREFLASIGTGSAPSAPTWGGLLPSDIPLVTCGGRIYCVSGSPWADGSSSGNSTLYFGPANSNMGNLITIGSTLQTFSEVSLTLSTSASTAYYVYVTSSSSTTVALGLAAWTNATTPPSTYSQNGQLYIDSGYTQLVVGGIYCVAASKVQDWAGARLVSNYFNAICKSLLAQDSTSSWTTSSTSPIVANGTATNGINQIQVFSCVQRDVVSLNNNSTCWNTSSSYSVQNWIYVDGTQVACVSTSGNGGYANNGSVSYSQTQVGLHTYTRYNNAQGGGTGHFDGGVNGFMNGTCIA